MDHGAAASGSADGAWVCPPEAGEEGLTTPHAEDHAGQGRP